MEKKTKKTRSIKNNKVTKTIKKAKATKTAKKELSAKDRMKVSGGSSQATSSTQTDIKCCTHCGSTNTKTLVAMRLVNGRIRYRKHCDSCGKDYVCTK